MLDRLKNLIRGAQDVTGQHATMRACMMGPRAVGKTTILTAIFHNTSESIAQTQLKFVPNADTLALMNVCSNQLNEIFEKKKSIEDRPIAGIAASIMSSGLKARRPQLIWKLRISQVNM